MATTRGLTGRSWPTGGAGWAAPWVHELKPDPSQRLEEVRWAGWRPFILSAMGSGRGGMRSLQYVAVLFVLAEELVRFPDPDLAGHRMRLLVAAGGIG